MPSTNEAPSTVPLAIPGLQRHAWGWPPRHAHRFASLFPSTSCSRLRKLVTLDPDSLWLPAPQVSRFLQAQTCSEAYLKLTSLPLCWRPAQIFVIKASTRHGLSVTICWRCLCQISLGWGDTGAPSLFLKGTERLHDIKIRHALKVLSEQDRTSQTQAGIPTLTRNRTLLSDIYFAMLLLGKQSSVVKLS